MIPRIIHQTWKTKSIPAEFEKYVLGWKTAHPDWEYYLWTDKDNREFVKRYYPWFLKQYDGYVENIHRADAIRYFLLYHMGGLYVDLDVECLKPFDEIISRHTCFFGNEPGVHSQNLYGKKRLVSNALMASEAGHRFWPHLFSVLTVSKHRTDVLEKTGPLMLQEACDSYPHQDIYIYPDQVFSPVIDLSDKNISKFNLTTDQIKRYLKMKQSAQYPEASYAVHHWAGTWCHPGLLESIRILGRKLRNRIKTGSNDGK